jgi:hypothetical protein
MIFDISISMYFYFNMCISLSWKCSRFMKIFLLWIYTMPLLILFILFIFIIHLLSLLLVLTYIKCLPPKTTTIIYNIILFVYIYVTFICVLLISIIIVLVLCWYISIYWVSSYITIWIIKIIRCRSKFLIIYPVCSTLLTWIGTVIIYLS